MKEQIIDPSSTESFFRLSNATTTTLSFSLPLLLLMLFVIGPFRHRAVYLITAILLFLGSGILLLLGSAMSQMAAGHGSRGSEGWEDWWPLPLWGCLGIPMIIIGFLIRPVSDGKEDNDKNDQN